MAASTEVKKQTKRGATDFVAGGVAGLFEALCCHPLDTIKVRMQLYRKSGQKPPGFIKTGLGAVVIGIVPKMAIRFSSYEFYRSFFYDKDGKITAGQTFLAGVGAGITESIMWLILWKLLKSDYKPNTTR
ncbi:unnamed protein product [Candida parapsilosis]